MPASQLSEQKLLTWLRSNPPSWQDKPILNWSDVLPAGDSVESSPFTISRKSDWGPIDMRSVVGQWEHYAGQTWIEALTDPQYKEHKMRHTIDRFDSERQYYFSQERKDIYFDSVDGQYWYSNGGGNHRTVVAKFGLEMIAALDNQRLPIIDNVHRTIHQIDWDTLSLYSHLVDFCNAQSLNVTILLSRDIVSRRIDETYMEELYEPTFFVTDGRFSDDMNNHLYGHLNRQQFKKYVEWIIECRGKINWLERLRYWSRSSNLRNSLMFPGFEPEGT